MKSEGNSNTTPRIALIGCGYWGKNHARNLNTLGVLEMICDPSENGRALAGGIAPSAAIVKDPNEIFDRQDIDGVVIATPAETHFALARQAFEAGKHVLVEKPMALTYEDAVAMEKSAAEHKRILMVGHLLEYHPAIEAIKKLLAQNYLGKLQYIYSNRLSFGKIRTEENALWSFAPHDISLILRLVGSQPSMVYCTGGSYTTQGIEDVCTANLQFEDTVRAHIFVNWLNPFKEQKLTLIGDQRMAVFCDTEPKDKLVIYNQRVVLDGQQPILEKGESEVIPLPPAEPLRAQCEAFLNAIQSGEAPLTDGKSGSNVLRVLQACQTSLEAAGKPVDLAQV